MYLFSRLANYYKCILNRTPNDPVGGRDPLTMARQGASHTLTQTVKPQFIGRLSSPSLINGGTARREGAYGNI